MNEAERNGECKVLIDKAGALGLRRRSRRLRRAGVLLKAPKDICLLLSTGQKNFFTIHFKLAILEEVILTQLLKI